MLKRILTYTLIVSGIGILYISTSKDVMSKISGIRNETVKWYGAHNSMDKGDLVNMSYLDYIKKFHSERALNFSKPAYVGPEDVNLYLHGDSYTFKIPDSAFAGVNRYEYAWVYQKHIAYNLDTTKVNILVLEHAERYLRIFYGGLDLLKIVYNAEHGSVYDSIAAHLPQPSIAEPVHEAFEGTIFHDVFKNVFNSNINQNLEYNLFNYNILNAPRLAKASLNYRLFNRASGNVSISENGNNLYLKETTDRDYQGSSYNTIPQHEYEAMVRNLNILYEHYKSEGFDEVYLAPIPNPVTILEPYGYNQLIPRLQDDEQLNIKFIDIYSTYTSTDKKVYRPGDTHWNSTGAQMWVDKVNEKLVEWNAD